MSFLLALGVALVLTPAARRAGLAAGVVDRPDGGGLKIHGQPVPLLGGAAVAAAALIAAGILGDRLPAVVIAATLIAFAAGSVDDVRPLPPWPRLVFLAAAGATLAAGGLRLGVAGPVGAMGIVALVMLLANAVNLLDGQDGLAGGVAAIGALGLGGLAALDAPASSGPAFALAGGLVGFLVWNRPPARIFLGNGGAYGVGVLLAVPAAGLAVRDGWRGMLAAGLCLGVPAYELAFTVVRRIAACESLGAGDRRHSYDLIARRTGRPAATAAFIAAQTGAVGIAFVIRAVPLAAGAAAAAFIATAAGVWGWRLWNRQETLVGE